MKVETFLLIAIDSTHLVIKLEKLLLSNGIEARIIPLPKEISASCGFSLKTDLKKAKDILTLFETEKLDGNLFFFYKIEKIGLKNKISTFIL